MTVILGSSPAVTTVVAQGRRIRMMERRESTGPSGTRLLLAMLQGRRRTLWMHRTRTVAGAVPAGAGQSPATSSVLGRACGCRHC